MKSEQNKQPLVSILIRCFNDEDHVRDAVDSSLEQTYGNVEVIAVDDGSTDGTVEILASYGDRIRWKSMPNVGASAARNEALAMARGEFVQYLDAENTLAPEKTERQLHVLLSDSADIVFCREYFFGDGRPERPSKRRIEPTEGIDPFVYALRHSLGIHGPLHRRSLLEQVSGFRPGVPFAQDLDLHVRLAAAGARIAFQDELLAKTRHDPAEARLSNRAHPAGAMLKLLLEIAEELLRRPYYSMPPHRCTALAGLIAQHGIYAFRNGAQSLPARAFKMAKSLDPNFAVEERPWYCVTARGIGYMNVERVLALVRGFRSRMPHQEV